MTASVRRDPIDVPLRPASRSLALARVLAIASVCAVAWWWLLRHADVQALAARAGELPAWAWVAAAAGLLAGHAMRALRLQREWRHLGHLPWLHCLRIVLAHNALVVMLPLRAGEAGFVLAVRRHWAAPWGTALLALLRWRLQDASVLAALAAGLLLPASTPVRIVAAIAAAALLWAVLPWLWNRLRRARGVAEGRGDEHFWAGAGASVAIWTFKVLANGGLLAALAGLPLLAAWRGALGGELAGVQPLQPPAGLGVYEAGTWFAAHVPAALDAPVISAALAVHAFSLAVALLSAALTQLLVPPAPRISEETC